MTGFLRCGILSLLIGLLAPAGARDHSFVIVASEGDKQTTVVTDADLIEYRWAEHAMVVGSDAMKRIADATRTRRLEWPFQVTVDGTPAYSGLFVSSASSKTYKQPTIWLEPGPTTTSTTTLSIRRPFYHEPEFLGQDPRFDDRARVALCALGKLKEGDPALADYDPLLTGRVSAVLYECKAIVPGITREKVPELFMAEGGLFTRTQQTLVLRRCPYVKIDAEFNISDPKSMDTLADTVKSVSKPYLAWRVID